MRGENGYDRTHFHAGKVVLVSFHSESPFPIVRSIPQFTHMDSMNLSEWVRASTFHRHPKQGKIEGESHLKSDIVTLAPESKLTGLLEANY